MSDKSAEINPAELVLLSALDDELFAKTFFEKTSRQASPSFHRDIDNALNGPDRFVNIQIFRGGAKTTKVRLHMAKRIAYGISKTILFVGKSHGHSTRNLMWIRKQVERNVKFRDTFMLAPGAKWNDEELEVLCGPEKRSVWVIGIGITGSARGINVDDYRPDFIIVDDVMDEENSSSIEQRDKTYKLVHGALKHSLAPASENSWAKLAILQTPLDFDDISQKALRDPEFVNLRFGCWTKDTENLPLDKRESAWPARWSSEELRKQRAAAISKNELSLFSREMECKLVAPEQSDFKPEWLKFYGPGLAVEEPANYLMQTVLVIDPVPPPSDREVSKNLQGKDYESLSVVGKYKGRIFILETSYNRGHDPSWTIAEFLRLAEYWKVSKVVVEAVAYQRTLVWLLQAAMKKAGRYWQIDARPDRRAKRDRIVQGIKGPASNGELYCRPDMTEFINQYTHYPNVKHDDVIETVAKGCEEVSNSILNDYAEANYEEEDIPLLEYQRGAP